MKQTWRFGLWLFTTMLTTAAAFGATGDWPQWRGPNRDSVSTETGLLKRWPAGGPPLIWKGSGLGRGYATLAIANRRIFTTGDKGDASYVVALNGADGKPLWTAKLGKTGAPGWGDFAGPRSTPTVDGDLVYALGQLGELGCFDAATGRNRWRKDLTKNFGGPLPEWGYAESPLVDGDKLVVTPGGSQGAVIALNKNSGALLWQSKEFKDEAHYASLVAAEIGGVRQYVVLTAVSVAGIAAVDGKLLWRARRRGDTAVVPTPICRNRLVYVTSGYGAGCNLFEVTGAADKFSAQQLYANRVMVNHHGGVVLAGNYVYGFSDSKGWTCQEFQTGKMIWQEKGKLGKGSLVFADGHLYLRQEDGKGTVALIEATPSGYRETGRFDPPDRSDANSWSHPVVAGGKLYLRDQEVLLCYDVKEK